MKDKVDEVVKILEYQADFQGVKVNVNMGNLELI
jgi:hypothetical protein